MELAQSGPEAVADPILVAVNTLWFSSLVLAIGAAITGMLAMTWRQAVLYVLSQILLTSSVDCAIAQLKSKTQASMVYPILDPKWLPFSPYRFSGGISGRPGCFRLRYDGKDGSHTIIRIFQLTRFI